MSIMFETSLAERDPTIFASIGRQLSRQQDQIELIASIHSALATTHRRRFQLSFGVQLPGSGPRCTYPW